MDHDQRFKALLQISFEEFMRLFFAEWADPIDFGSVVWLENEVFPLPPDGKRGLCDLVAKVRVTKPVEGMHPADAKEWLVIVHVEIDASTGTVELKSRFPYYYLPLRGKYMLPVLPIALFLKVGLKGIGIDTYEERFWGLKPLKLEYLYAGLPALDAIQYLEGDNLLGVALSALMRIPKERVVELGAAAYRRIQNADVSDQKKFLLGECVEAYLPLDADQERQLEGLLRIDSRKEVPAMNLTSYDKGILKGIETGREEGRRLALLDVLKEELEAKFNFEGLHWFEQLPADISLDKLTELRRAVRSASQISSLEPLFALSQAPVGTT